MMANLLVLNGPNLNLLGTREPELYGSDSLDTVTTRLTDQAAAHGHTLAAFQSNSERALIERVQATRDDGTDFILVNPAGLTHHSVPLRDAFAASGTPFIEVHITNPHAREPFRRQSMFSDIAVGVVCGFGTHSYDLALEAALKWISAR
jgi:3-dehydroquinate dehydratase-2